MSLEVRAARKPTPPHLAPRVERAVAAFKDWRNDEDARDGLDRLLRNMIPGRKYPERVRRV